MFGELRFVESKTPIKEEKICQLKGCGNVIKNFRKANDSRKETKFCSAACRLQGSLKYGQTSCVNCSTFFRKRTETHIACSVKCLYEYQRGPDRFCNNDGCGNKLSNRDKTRKYCSFKCSVEKRFGNIQRFNNCQREGCCNKLTQTQKGNGTKYCSRACYLATTRDTVKNIVKISFFKKKGHEYPRRFIKTSTGWKLLCNVIWEQKNGPIPHRYYIKFKDGNTFNDEDIDNMYLNSMLENIHPTIKKIKNGE